MEAFQDIQIVERCTCVAHLWIRESGRMGDGGGFYIVKFCKECGDYPTTELVRTTTGAPLKAEVDNLKRQQKAIVEALYAINGLDYSGDILKATAIDVVEEIVKEEK